MLVKYCIVMKIMQSVPGSYNIIKPANLQTLAPVQSITSMSPSVPSESFHSPNYRFSTPDYNESPYSAGQHSSSWESLNNMLEGKDLPLPTPEPNDDDQALLSKYVDPEAFAALVQEKILKGDTNSRYEAITFLEDKIVTMQGHCPNNVIDRLKIRTFQLNTEIMNNYLNMFDSNYQDGVGCLVDALVSNDQPIQNGRLNRWIADIQHITDPSSDKTAVYRLINIDQHPLFVVKVATEDDSLAHEAVVGMGAINKLRMFVPNFMQTYGVFRCNPPVIDDNNKLVTWCSGTNRSVNYLVLENIPGKSLRKMAPSITGPEFINIYIQVVNALAVAHTYFDFTHYDLHADNVMIQTLPFNISIPIYIDREIVGHIVTNMLAKIIDYGFSYAEIETVPFGNYGYENVFAIYTDRSYPMHDAYKLLATTYKASLPNGTESFAMAAYDIFSLFDDGAIDERIEQQMKTNKTKETKDTDLLQPLKFIPGTYDDLLKILLDHYPEQVTKEKPENALLAVCGDSCMDWNQILDNIFVSRNPQTLQDYCMALRAITEVSASIPRDYIEVVQEKLNNFDVRNALIDELRESKIEVLLLETLTEYRGAQLSNVRSSEFNKVIYKKQLVRLAEITWGYNRLSDWLNYARCAFEYEDDVGYFEEVVEDLLIINGDITKRIQQFRVIIDGNTDLDYDIDIRELHDIIDAAHISQ